MFLKSNKLTGVHIKMNIYSKYNIDIEDVKCSRRMETWSFLVDKELKIERHDLMPLMISLAFYCDHKVIECKNTQIQSTKIFGCTTCKKFHLKWKLHRDSKTYRNVHDTNVAHIHDGDCQNQYSIPTRYTKLLITNFPYYGDIERTTLKSQMNPFKILCKKLNIEIQHLNKSTVSKTLRSINFINLFNNMPNTPLLNIGLKVNICSLCKDKGHNKKTCPNITSTSLSTTTKQDATKTQSLIPNTQKRKLFVETKKQFKKCKSSDTHDSVRPNRKQNKDIDLFIDNKACTYDLNSIKINDETSSNMSKKEIIKHSVEESMFSEALEEILETNTCKLIQPSVELVKETNISLKTVENQVREIIKSNDEIKKQMKKEHEEVTYKLDALRILISTQIKIQSEMQERFFNQMKTNTEQANRSMSELLITMNETYKTNHKEEPKKAIVTTKIVLENGTNENLNENNKIISNRSTPPNKRTNVVDDISLSMNMDISRSTNASATKQQLDIVKLANSGRDIISNISLKVDDSMGFKHSLTNVEKNIVTTKLSEKGNDNDYIVQLDNKFVIRKSYQTLNQRRWLSDEVINFFFLLLAKRDEKICNQQDGMKRSHFFNSFFITKILDEGSTNKYTYANVKTWSKVSLFFYLVYVCLLLLLNCD